MAESLLLSPQAVSCTLSFLHRARLGMWEPGNQGVYLSWFKSDLCCLQTKSLPERPLPLCSWATLLIPPLFPFSLPSLPSLPLLSPPLSSPPLATFHSTLPSLSPLSPPLHSSMHPGIKHSLLQYDASLRTKRNKSKSVFSRVRLCLFGF